MNSERKLITEYFNKYYPKKTYYVHNEVFELLLGVFFGFFFSALKDSISNRAVQVVSSFQDEGKSRRFFDEAEKVTSELERYATENKELSEKLEKIEKVLEELKSNTTESRETSNSAEPRPTPEPEQEKDSPVVSELSNFTTQVLQLLQELQNNSKKQTQELRDSVEVSQKVLIGALAQVGVNQQTLIKKFNENVQKAQEAGSIKEEDVDRAAQALSAALPQETEEMQQVEAPKSKKGDKERTKKNKHGVSTLSKLLIKNQLSLEGFLSGVVRFAKEGESTYTVTKSKNNNFTFNFVQSTLTGKSLSDSVPKKNGEYVFTVENTVFGESLYSLYSYFVTLYEQDGVTVVTVSATLNTQDEESVFFTVKESELKSVGLLVQESDTTNDKVTVTVSDAEVTFNDGNKEVNFVLGNSTSIKNARKLLATLLRNKKVTKSDVKSAAEKLKDVKTKLLTKPQTVSVSDAGKVTVGDTTVGVSVPEVLYGKKVEVQNPAVIEGLSSKSTSVADLFLSSDKKPPEQLLVTKKEELVKPEPKKEESKKEELVKTKLDKLIKEKKVFKWSDFLKNSTGDESNTFTFTKIESKTVLCTVSVVNYEPKKRTEVSKVLLESVATSVNLKNFFYKLFESEASDSQSSLGFPGFTGEYTLELALDKFNIEGDKLTFPTVQQIFILDPTVYYRSKAEWKEKRAVEFFTGLLNKKYPLSVFLSKGDVFNFKSDESLSTNYLTFTDVKKDSLNLWFKVFLGGEFNLTDTVEPQVSTFEAKQHLTQKSVTYYEAETVTLNVGGFIDLKQGQNKEVEVNERTGTVTFTQKGTDEILKTIKKLQIEVQKKQKENKEKEAVVLSTLESFIDKKLKFPIVELSEKKTSLKASESLVQYFTFENLTEDKESVVVTGEVQNLSTDSTEPFSAKVELNERKQTLQNLLYVLFEEENKKKYSGTFKVTLKVKEDFQVEGKKVFLSPEGAQKVLSAVTEAKQPVQTQQPATQGSEVSVQEPEQEPEAPEAEHETVPTQPTPTETPTERKPIAVTRWPKLLYYSERRKTLPLKENSPLLTESPQSGTFVRLKYDSVDKTTNVATYVGEVEYDAKTALPKSALSAVLEAVLNQERGQQLKVSVASYSKDEKGNNQYSVVSVLQKGKLTSDGSSTLTRLLSTGDSEANKQLASDNFATGVLSGNQISLKNFTTLPTDNQNYVLVFPVGSSLLFLPLTEDKLPETLTALRGLARQKSKTFPLYNANGGKKITVQGHDEKDFQSNLLVIIEKLKSLVKPQNYSKALQQSRTQFKQPKIDSENVKFGFLSGSFDKEKGFKGPYTVLGVQEKQQ